ncbi:Hypothetical protein UVM_LOCUS369 [uncultured virus]|nr:Hypothetical protein UVM_LOCUS369 [uncultured virus]
MTSGGGDFASIGSVASTSALPVAASGASDDDREAQAAALREMARRRAWQQATRCGGCGGDLFRYYDASQGRYHLRCDSGGLAVGRSQRGGGAKAKKRVGGKGAAAASATAAPRCAWHVSF